MWINTTLLLGNVKKKNSEKYYLCRSQEGFGQLNGAERLDVNTVVVTESLRLTAAVKKTNLPRLMLV
jgi:hypothetical protein